jgi:phospholipid-binding lipoprotein MlaA
MAIAFAGMLVLGGCATPPPADDPDAVAEYKENNDPLEPTNRVFYAVNDAVDTVIIRPIALGYRAVVPQPLQSGVHNVLANLDAPVVFANDLLQVDPQRAKMTAARFALNSTLGAFGLFDPATGMGFPGHDSDLGMTFAVWGMPDGIFLFLPGLGPTNPRDAVAFGIESYGMSPWGWIGQGRTVRDLRLVRTGLSALDARVGVLDSFDKVKAEALDPYATIRSLARQYRTKQIDDARDGSDLTTKKSP